MNSDVSEQKEGVRLKHKFNWRAVIALIVFLLFVPSVISASTDLNVTLNDKKMTFPDEKPFINEDNRTMVPVRFISQGLGYYVSWNDATRTVSISNHNKEVKLTIDSNIVHINSKSVTIDTKARIINGRTFVPIRFVSQSLNASIGFDSATRTVILTKPELPKAPPEPVDESIYTLELARFNVYNDGTHALETTLGINEALLWAKENGKKTLIIPNGTYLISKGDEKKSTASKQINMVSDMTLQLSKDAIFQKETNGDEGYAVIRINAGTKNVTVRGGTLIGDRDTHDYSKKQADWSAGTHEWGNGLDIAGGTNIIVENMNIQKMTGDGVFIGGSTITASTIKEAHLEPGGLDDNGQPIVESGKIRTVGRTVTNFDKEAYDTFKTIDMWLPKNLMSKDVKMCYYRSDNSFISCEEGRVYSKSTTTPEGADYFRAVFDATSPSNVEVQAFLIDNAKNVIIRNNDIGYNRRQGITAGGENVEIINNSIHHTSGTAPQSGIDIEPGFYPARDITIKGNDFYNNIIQMVFAYGDNAIVEENTFKTENLSGSIGFYVHPGFRGVKTLNNTFHGSGLHLGNDNSYAKSNTFINSSASLSGADQVFEDATFTDSEFSIGKKPGSLARNLRFINTEGNTVSKNIYFDNKQATLRDITVEGKPSGAVFLGHGSEDNLYENITLTNTGGSSIPAGTYKGCTFQYSGSTTMAFNLNDTGAMFDNCSFIDATLYVNNLYSYTEMKDITVKNSTFTYSGDIKYPAIYTILATNINVTNNAFTANHLTKTHEPIVKLGRHSWTNRPTDVHGATVNGNTITTNLAVSGIHSTEAGIGSPPYTIQNNTLTNATISAKPEDILSGNILK